MTRRGPSLIETAHVSEAILLAANLNKGMLLRIAAWRPSWEAQFLCCCFLALGAEEAICCWPILAAPYNTSSSGSGVLAGAACRWSQAKPSQARACFPLLALLAVWEAVQTFPSSLVMAWGSEQARFHHRSWAGTSLLSTEGKIEGCNSSPFSYTRHLGGSDFRVFCPSCWSCDLQGIALTTCAF